MEVKEKNVFVGLSGGVDSAVSAALLRRAGAQVTGVFIKGWYPPGLPCTWALDRRDAMRVAARLKIPFITLDAGKEYKESVIDYLLAEYQKGRTPNPDVMCNRDIKFGVFYRFAKEHGADAIATGHYRSGQKDQSYFLWAVPKEVLSATLFPVGHREKREVRCLAAAFDLPVAEKRDSQGICFLGSVDVEKYLRRELGTDNPALLHTIGQRVEGKYVAAKNIATGELTLSFDRGGARGPVHFSEANWHEDECAAAYAQLRYRGARVRGHLEGSSFVPAEALPELSVPGQSIVFYTEDGALAGGGIIE